MHHCDAGRSSMANLGRLLSRLTIAAAMAAALHTSAHAAASVAKVSRAVPVVRASGAGGDRILRTGADLFTNDTVSTGASGIAEIEFGGLAKLAVASSSRAAIGKGPRVSVARGAFRWIDGASGRKAAALRTPLATIESRGAAFDFTLRKGRLFVVLLTGRLRVCAKSGCQNLQNPGDFTSTVGSKLLPVKDITAEFKSRAGARDVFPFLAYPDLLSLRFRVRGSNLLTGQWGSGFVRPSFVGGHPRRSSNASGGGCGGAPPPGGGSGNLEVSLCVP